MTLRNLVTRPARPANDGREVPVGVTYMPSTPPEGLPLSEFIAGQACARRELASPIAVDDDQDHETPRRIFLPTHPTPFPYLPRDVSPRPDVTEIPSHLANTLTSQGQRITGCGGVPLASHHVLPDTTDTFRPSFAEEIANALASDAHPLVNAKRDLETAQTLVRRARELIASVTPQDQNDPRHRATRAGIDARSAQLLLDDAIERLHNLGVA